MSLIIATPTSIKIIPNNPSVILVKSISVWVAPKRIINPNNKDTRASTISAAMKQPPSVSLVHLWDTFSF